MRKQRTALFLLLALLPACGASVPRVQPSTATAEPISSWPVRTAPHVDLWIHSFAMLTADSAVVPLYRRGYKDSMTVVKNRANVLTSLDANRETLGRQLAQTPVYLQAQFLAFEFDHWDQLRLAVERFLEYQGDPSRARDRNTAQAVATIGAVFRTSTDREWLRLFFTGVVDEASRFYLAERQRLTKERNDVVASVDSMWQNRYRTAFERFLNNSSQRNGDLLLSVPLGGEGRATMRGNRSVVAVTLPARVSDAHEAILVFAHEVTGTLVNSVVADNTTPVEQRSGAAERMVAIGQVRAGALLVQRVAPELLEAYVRFYLAQGGHAAGSSLDALVRAYPLPSAVADGITRQVDIVLGGI